MEEEALNLIISGPLRAHPYSHRAARLSLNMTMNRILSIIISVGASKGNLQEIYVSIWMRKYPSGPEKNMPRAQWRGRQT